MCSFEANHCAFFRRLRALIQLVLSPYTSRRELGNRSPERGRVVDLPCLRNMPDRANRRRRGPTSVGTSTPVSEASRASLSGTHKDSHRSNSHFIHLYAERALCPLWHRECSQSSQGMKQCQRNQLVDIVNSNIDRCESKALVSASENIANDGLLF
jgi:hypothetical protein